MTECKDLERSKLKMLDQVKNLNDSLLLKEKETIQVGRDLWGIEEMFWSLFATMIIQR